MKTPREILSERHRSAEPQLDAIRKAVVAEHIIAPQFKNEQRRTINTISLASKLWMELILPARRFWFAMAGAWVVILVLNCFGGGGIETTGQTASAPAPDTLMAVKEQRHFMAQLLEPTASPVNQVKTEKPSPRSEQRKQTPVA